MKFILKAVMYILIKLRKEQYHYLSVPEDILSWVKIDRIMKLGHALPSVIVAILFAVKLFPLFSISYAEQLEENGTVIPIAFICVLIPLLLINGYLIEIILEKTNDEYKGFKNSKN